MNAVSFSGRLLGKGAFAIGGLFILFGSFGFIETGFVGVRSTLKQVSSDEVESGIYLKWPLISSVRPILVKEVEVPLINLTPKANDNLSLRDLDVSVYYTTNPSKVADLMVKYAGQTAPVQGTDQNGNIFYMDDLAPAYLLVRSVAREAVYTAVGKQNSLTLHQRREELALAIQNAAQAKLDADDKGTFTVTRVVVRQALTDMSIEQSIQAAVANQKKLEAMEVQVDIARKEAEVEVIKAEGIAKAQQIISGTLTREYLIHQRNEVLKIAAEKGTLNTMVVPEGTTPFLQAK